MCARTREPLNAEAHEVVDEEDQVGRRLAEQVLQAMELKVTPDVPSHTDCQ